MKNSSRLLAVAMCAAFGSGIAQATVINGGFETGDLTGWTPSLSGGAAMVVTSNSTTYGGAITYLPPEGSYFLAIMSGSANVWQTVTQSLALAAGETIGGLAAFDWGDYPSYYDGARVRILDAAGAQIAEPFYLDGAGHPSGYNGPWTAWDFTSLAAGTYTVEYAARNTLDGSGLDQTFGYFDATHATQAVPEPASLALLGIGLAGLGAMRRRKPMA